MASVKSLLVIIHTAFLISNCCNCRCGSAAVIPLSVPLQHEEAISNTEQCARPRFLPAGQARDLNYV